MVVSFSLFSLFLCHGNALYSYLLLILCFFCFLMVGFHHGFGRDSSPWALVVSFFIFVSFSMETRLIPISFSFTASPLTTSANHQQPLLTTDSLCLPLMTSTCC